MEEETYQCDECRYGFATPGWRRAAVKRLIYSHSLAVHGVGSSLAAFRQSHQRRPSRLSDQRAACDECSKTFDGVRSRLALTRHLALRHSELKLYSQKVFKAPRVACDDCTRLFSKKDHLFGHHIIEHGLVAARKVHCDQCPAMLEKSSLFAHWLSAHSTSRFRALLTRAPRSKVACEDCGQRFLRKHLWSHWAAKHGGRRELLGEKSRPKVACDDCESRLFLRANIHRHWLYYHRS